MGPAMTLSALLVCLDDAAGEVLQRVLQELSIAVETCPDFARATIRLAQDRFDLLVVDAESYREVVQLLHETHLARKSEGTLAVVVVSGQESVSELFSLGVNFAIFKPVAYDRALSSLRAARALMRKEKRRKGRASVHTHAMIDYANVEREKATLIDLAEDGMSILFGKKLTPTSKVYFQFTLPGQSASVRLSGQVVWQDWNGRAGVQFIDVPKASRKLINEFLTANLPTVCEKEELQEVTVEMDEGPVQHLSIPLETPAGRKPHTPKHDSVPHKHSRTQDWVEFDSHPAAASSHDSRPGDSGKNDAPRDAHKKDVSRADSNRSDSRQAGSRKRDSHSLEDNYGQRSVPRTAVHTDDRRTKERYACRIGAEVYRTGTSVPNHCNLTDLSSGGCYLEVSLPFPAGSSVEIVVRTYELKLRLRGAVQASHPGFGMGIAFELKSKEERENVKRLLDFVASTTDPS